MGCGASVPQVSETPVTTSKKNVTEHKAAVQDGPAAWASKTSEAQVSSSAKAAMEERRIMAAMADEEIDSEYYGTQGPKSRKNEQPSVVEDLNSDSDVEIICEAKAVHQSPAASGLFAANGQEAPADDDEFPEPGTAAFKADEEKTSLSKQEQEQAAKMAEQRKRFDEKRYAQTQQPNPVVPTGPYDRQPAVKVSNKAHEVVMGLNDSATPGAQKANLVIECVPGGIMDEGPRQAQNINCRNNHRAHLDDDDEMIMKEILEADDA